MVSVDAPPALALLARRGVETFALDDENDVPGQESRSVQSLLRSSAALAFIHRRAPVRLMVFKTNALVERICGDHGWDLLAAPAGLSRRWENKLAFRELAAELGLRQPPGMVVEAGETDYAAIRRRLGPSFVLQSPHGYSGSRTMLVQDGAAFEAAVPALRAPQLRATAFLSGQPLTLNACVTARGVAVSAPFVQVTGEEVLTRYPLGSCGNDWSAAQELGLDASPYVAAAERIGQALAGGGYRGVFGVDFVVGDDGQPVLIEVNPRLVASIALYTQLELLAGRLPLLARHILAFLAPDLDVAPLDAHLAPANGSQLILHNLRSSPSKVHADLGAGILAGHPVAATGHGPILLRPAVHVADLDGGQQLLLAPGRGRVVSAGQELGRIQSRTAMVTSAGRLLPGQAPLVRRLETAMGLEAPAAEAPP